MTESEGQGGDGRTGQGADGAPEAPALAIIEAFGGIRPMAKTLGLAVSTVQGWKERSAIPANRHDQIRAAARQHDIAIDPEVLRASAGDAAATQPQTIEGQVIEGKTTQDAAAGDKAAGEKAADKAAEKAAEKAGSKPGEASRTSAASATGAASRKPGRPAGESAPRRAGAFLPGLVAGVVLAALVAGATVYTRPYWAPAADGAVDGQIDAVAARLSDLDARLGELQGNLPPDSTEALSSMNERLSTLESALSQGAGQDPQTRAALESLGAQQARIVDRIAALEQEVSSLRNVAGQPSAEVTERLSSAVTRLDELLDAQSELSARLAAAEADLDAAEAARDARPGGRETLLLLAALQLRDALRGSGPYAEPLAMLKNLAGDDPALGAIVEPLERRASVGLPSLRDLQAAFPEVARRLVAIEAGAEGEGWSSGVLRRLSEAVNLRPVGHVEGSTPSAVAARAEVKLNAGDLAGALAELDGLDGAAAEAAASWRRDAEARLAADGAVSRLGTLVSERFTSMIGP
ncbi:MAG: COG4223 family protein [Kiloniellaceae bacterium]